jgi:hypothetical protein
VGAAFGADGVCGTDLMASRTTEFVDQQCAVVGTLR